MRKVKVKLYFVLLFLFLPKGWAFEKTEDFLQRFARNPSVVMDEIPEKFNVRSNPSHQQIFPHEQILTGNFLIAKDRERRQIMNHSRENSNKAAINDIPGDQAAKLIDHPEQMVDNLEQMEVKKLMTAKLPTRPWSDDYWATYEGMLGHRYADHQMEALNSSGDKTWKVLWDYVQKNPLKSYVYSGKIDLLSPAEKYDLLLGLEEEGLTQKMWQEGESFYESTGKVETWMGLCHGWAPASYMLPRPTNRLKVMAADGQTVLNFYPSDIKALGTLLWAKANFPTHFAGGRCDRKKPKKDEHGRIIDPECFDNNPGTWHLAVVNQIGVSQRSFVIDATYDYEVWNQPVVEYSYRYFNPKTRRIQNTLDEAKVELKDFPQDLFKRYRGRETTTLVGIEMRLTYLSETDPTHEVSDSPDKDRLTTVLYRYDLELNDQGTIVGGEWYSNAHPDFLWSPEENVVALSPFDNSLEGEWNDIDKTILPSQWKEEAKKAVEQGMPLAKIVTILFSASVR